MTSPFTELNDRARDVFRIVVESYLETGQPVGSRTISKTSAVNLSPASIRNVMQDLEELGLLAAPHTSAGRMPTEQGLRLFVDGMMQVAEPSAEERAAIEKQLESAGPIEAALAATTQALSGLSACAGIVMVPRREPILRQMNFVRLSDNQVLAVLVGHDGSIENRVLEMDRRVTDSMLVQAGNFISARLSGRSLPQALAALEAEILSERAALDTASSDLVRRGLAMWSRDGSDRPVLIVRGQANLLDNEAVADLERVRRLLDELEAMQDIAHLLDSAREAGSARIFIGAENKLFSLSGSSVIAAPYRDGEGRVVGVVGVIGPTRLNYARIVPMVDFTAQSLTRLLK
ncbi:heat-inducible transcriptional repressor HrcA [Sphingomonas ursincola]|jgi:heat-inducible transcriptional repressor|uniref:Heat-inducible transcription repressor HrcA n=1 Tax=Sphingomonas ursincola TaxID=56361 RepID=A0A7V8RFX9_9SPHN|nr:heat-inducible transcriptional repressor HrcA [Sphingomonas ursincola]MBA1375739.1 heat-inducible transcriptional repressor HrcA [Sphingomonas ursincola]MBY0620163.1 heat-inducible transcriptional repressor HrcA [Sphingomonas ursincola]